MIGSRRASRTVRVTRRGRGEEGRTKDSVAVEEPLEVRVSWHAPEGRRSVPFAVTMRTPGDDFELVAGFLNGEGVIRAAEDVAELTYCSGPDEQRYNVVEARLRPGVSFDVERLRRNVYTSSSCGVCGKASLEAVEAIRCESLAEGPVVPAERIAELPERLTELQGVFARTGGLHAAGVFGVDGDARVVREDVGRHNAVDKVVGHLLLDRRLPAHDAVLVVSGRASFELVQKAVLAGIPMLVAVGAPSSLAVDLAQSSGQTLVGFARDGGFNVYGGEQRIG